MTHAGHEIYHDAAKCWGRTISERVPNFVNCAGLLGAHGFGQVLA